MVTRGRRRLGAISTPWPQGSTHGTVGMGTDSGVVEFDPGRCAARPPSGSQPPCDTLRAGRSRERTVVTVVALLSWQELDSAEACAIDGVRFPVWCRPPSSSSMNTLAAMCIAFAGVTLIPLTAVAIGAIGRAVGNHNGSQLLRLKRNFAAALRADMVLAKRADSKVQ